MAIYTAGGLSHPMKSVLLTMTAGHEHDKGEPRGGSARHRASGDTAFSKLNPVNIRKICDTIISRGVSPAAL
jgi:hypothetical protein